MTKLFRFEYRRLFRQKSFIIFAGVTAALVFLSLGSIKLMELALNTAEQQIYSIFGIKYSGSAAVRDAASNGNVSLIIAVVTGIFVCSEYSHGTLKTVVSAGFSRLKIFTAEFITALTSAFLLFATATVSAFVFGSLFWGVGELDSETAKAVLLQLLLTLALTAVLFMLAKAVKKTGGAIALGIFAPSLLSLILSVFDLALDNDKFKLAHYWISGSLSEIQATSPFNANIFDLINRTSTTLTSEITARAIIVSVVYIVSAFLLGNVIFRKQEI